MKLPVKDIQGNAQGELEVTFPMVEGGKGTQAVHDVVVAFRAAQRSGTACTKTMGDVAGSGKKPWRQKGTGRARAGSFASPLWRGGGVVFGPKPRDFTKKVSRSTRQLALRKALTERLKAGDVQILSELTVDSGRSKDFVSLLKTLEVTNTALFVSDRIDDKVHRASRNVAKIEMATSDTLNTYQVLRSDKLIFTRAAFQKLEERLK